MHTHLPVQGPAPTRDPRPARARPHKLLSPPPPLPSPEVSASPPAFGREGPPDQGEPPSPPGAPPRTPLLKRRRGRNLPTGTFPECARTRDPA
ncbi:hypothetical protein CW362_06235 [Streptomyces populi]|uniref:Uncharacterized protein n=1 Tax=Streptomyces populi TaxID=2058924 RepID=A0A2I0SVK5_9ACTN|nr:hypothetical protein CW362_06235 [Streptomyces populi]